MGRFSGAVETLLSMILFVLIIAGFLLLKAYSSGGVHFATRDYSTLDQVDLADEKTSTSAGDQKQYKIDFEAARRDPDAPTFISTLFTD